MKIQNFDNKAESPESKTEDAPKTAINKRPSKGSHEPRDTPTECPEATASKGQRDVGSFFGAKIGLRNENLVTTIFAGLKTKEDERDHYNFLN